jgi:hypothetical protein
MCKAVEAASILLGKRCFKSLFTGAVEKILTTANTEGTGGTEEF